MTGRIVRLSPIALVLALVACGSTRTVTVTTAVTTIVAGTQGALTAPVRIYFVRDGKLAPVARTLPVTRAALLDALAKGPTPAERQLGISAGSATYAPLQSSRTAQAVYTLSQFDPTQPVEFGGKRSTRADFEDLTPSILIESPLPFQEVRGPVLHATGTANTFEATFEYELTDPAGKVIAHHFVTATSGSGTRGTFDFSVPFTVDRAGLGKLTVYESSAANGKRIHVVKIPVHLAP